MHIEHNIDYSVDVNVPVYLDYNATTPVDERVFVKMAPFFTKKFGNSASSNHSFGWDAQDAVEDARSEIAKLINVNSIDIFFTSGATESANLALKGIAQHYRNRGNHIITSAIEHPAVLDTCKRLEETGCNITYLPVNREGHIEIEQLEKAITEQTNLIALMTANNEIGTVYLIAQFAEISHSRGIPFFTDVTQALGKVPVDLEASNIDLAAFSSHKIYGPKGVGALYARRQGQDLKLIPQMDGGGQEKGMRSGTLNVGGIVGFGEACKIARVEMFDEAKRLVLLRDRLEGTLMGELPDVWINGDKEARLPNTSNVGFGGIDARALIRDMYSIAVSTTAACASNADGPSHVLTGLGLTGEQAYSCVRFSLGRLTTELEIDYAIAKVISSVRKLRNR